MFYLLSSGMLLFVHSANRTRQAVYPVSVLLMRGHLLSSSPCYGKGGKISRVGEGLLSHKNQ